MHSIICFRIDIKTNGSVNIFNIFLVYIKENFCTIQNIEQIKRSFFSS